MTHEEKCIFDMNNEEIDKYIDNIPSDAPRKYSRVYDVMANKSDLEMDIYL